MKTTTIPSLRVSPDLRKQAEDVLEQGETLSGFVLDALTRSIREKGDATLYFFREKGRGRYPLFLVGVGGPG